MEGKDLESALLSSEVRIVDQEEINELTSLPEEAYNSSTCDYLCGTSSCGVSCGRCGNCSCGFVNYDFD